MTWPIHGSGADNESQVTGLNERPRTDHLKEFTRHMAYQYILVDRKDGVVTLTMHDPATLNAWNNTMGAELFEELTRINQDPDDRVVILTGTGERGFNSGANMKEMSARGSIGSMASVTAREAGDAYHRFDPPLTAIQKVTDLLRTMTKATIAAVNGAAAGGGMGLAAACDIRLASVNAKFTSVFVRRGLVPDEGSLYLLPQLIGMGKTLELVLTGRLIDAQEAERIGFVSKVVPADQLMPEANAIATDIAVNCPPITTGLIKQVFRRAHGCDFRETMRIADTAFQISIQTDDHQEAVRAYAEKRAPRFQNR